MNKIRFDELDLSAEMLRAIADMGFEEASPIQTEAIPHLLAGRDIIGQAQTGTGKTAAFGIPAVEMIEVENPEVQAIILCPTRELAIQVSEEVRKLTKYKHGIQSLPVYGGASIDRQISALRRGVHIVIGTPGRVMDHLERRTLRLDQVRMVVLDEADEMLDMGFRDDIETILQHVPEERQTVFFSATMSKPILELTKKYQHDPAMVKVTHETLTVSNIEQSYFEVRRGQKTEVLSRLLDMFNLKLVLVFCNTKRMVDDLVTELQGRGYFADGLHGDLSQHQRNAVMSKFRNGTIEILVATDVAARGIDVENVEAVFNYDVPVDEEAYVHRIGRTGRAGKAGKAFTFVIGRDIYSLKDIQKYTKAKIIRQEIPSYEDVKEIKMNLFLDKVKEVIQKGHLAKHVHAVERLIDQDYTSLDIAAALVKLAMGEEKAKEKSAEQLTKGVSGPKEGMVRLFLTLGKKDKVSPKEIVAAIVDEANVSPRDIGDIDLYDRFSFIEVRKELEGELLNKAGRLQIRGKMASLDRAQAKELAAAGSEQSGRQERDERPRSAPRSRSDRGEGGGYPKKKTWKKS